MKLKCKKLNPEANLPVRSTDGSAAYDFFCFRHDEVMSKNSKCTGWDVMYHHEEPDPYGVRLESRGGTCIFRTGIAVEIPKGYVGLCFSRSGDGFKRDLRLSNCVGVIDSDYRGEIRVKLRNDNSDYEYQHVMPQDRIMQMVIVKHEEWEVEEVQTLSKTKRAEGGFGSTGQ